MKRQRKPKAAVIFSKLFDSKAFTFIGHLTRFDHVHPPENYVNFKASKCVFFFFSCLKANLIKIELRSFSMLDSIYNVFKKPQIVAIKMYSLGASNFNSL